MKWFMCYLCLCFCGGVMGNFSFTYDMVNSCREYTCQHGYLYETFFRADSEEYRREKSDESLVFEMHIAILGASNGHILLSTVAFPQASDPVYEIVIGGGGNKFTELRRNLRRNAKTSVKTHQILSPIEFRAFYIKISEDGLIEFGKEGDILPIFSFMDVDPITINYFSFAAWSGVEIKFLYDCPIPGSKSKVTPNSQAVDPKLSNSDKLKRTLLSDKDPIIPPSPQVAVQLGIKVTSVAYDAFESKLTTGVSIVMKWTDNSMAWNPSKFNNTDSLTFRLGQIWSPKFHVFNSASIGLIDARNPELITMVNSGEATYHMHATIKTWCFDYGNTLTRWPRDEYVCAIVIQPWEAHEKITLKNIDVNSMKTFALTDTVIQNAWEVSSSHFIVNVSSWNEMYPTDDNTTHQSDRFVLKVILKRNASAYNIVFYTPLLVLVTFVLLSFWTEPVNLSRIWFYTSCVIIICLGLCYIDYMVPCHTVPSILVLYITVLGGVLLAIFIQVALMTSLAQRLCRSSIMQNIVTAQWFRSVFCLPQLKLCHIYDTINESSSNQEDDDGTVGKNIEEMQSDKVQYSETRELAEAIDKCMFVVYSVAFAVLLALHF
ncbi:neuronal acetylcholine receptor subunit beta-3 [Colias croceus]|uniref:neuronal acetylcholine receptor subunit beta-3 n=1 Tax=Colias crocea TaxID=72248 RepID=UPI001E27A597|nr:neuronal acetylcholine receptor subunit beta-3 [Colias croceus]